MLIKALDFDDDFEAVQCISHKTNAKTVKRGKFLEGGRTFDARRCEYVSARKFKFLRACSDVYP